MDKIIVENHLRKIIKEWALYLISRSEKKYTQNRLLEEIIIKTCADRGMVKELIRELVDEGELFYTYQYGCSFLERSIYKVFSVSERVLLAPA
ncbi:MAG: hypothetical protein C0403_02475, partial [Desulfobacterium sp.]|nr:hypothetical protein [Desulfobacterium sp.]